MAKDMLQFPVDICFIQLKVNLSLIRYIPHLHLSFVNCNQ